MSIKLLQDSETDSVAIVWPDMDNLKKYGDELKTFYKDFIKSLLQSEAYVFLIINKRDDIKKLTNNFSHKLLTKLKKIVFSCDDIWIRDYSPLIGRDSINNNYVCINYHINGYGKKYNYKKNDNFNKIFNDIFFKNKVKCIKIEDIFLEGGNFTFDKDIILFNIHSLKCHNKKLLKQDSFKSTLVNMGYKIENIDIENISGDDTNGHIDNLVRIYNNNILYMSSNDKSHPDYEILKELSKQLNNMRTSLSKYNFIPINHTIKDTITHNGSFLPFSYLNYLHCGKTVFLPKIGSVSKMVKNILIDIFKDNQIVFIDVSTVLKEYGGLHCCTINFKYNEY